ncbi:CDP-glycerol glycerophosphotransferase family protein [Pediococcus acidilactici]|uniref:CDP-glycerol glycerophosphotransferase family protein n=1 Tax=Pediococcus acidilactici TaxID=1254 RepID=UPI00137BE3C2|nr:CDP-glycerol glycerophosphotransferase family protein [Pediococcus acidilactici]QHS02346.1 CDP-glycerol--glycerophosphate glycerophosphotransferase [Pediococcus acidilactici]
MKTRIMSSKVLSKLLIFFVKLSFSVLQLFIKVNQKKILFSSFSGRKYDDSPQVLYEELKSDKKFEDYSFVWVFKKENKELPSEIQVRSNTFKYFVALLTSKYWISNSSIEELVPLNSKNHVYINTWHGVPIKFLGNDQKKDSYLARNWYTAVKFNLLLSSGDYDSNLFRKIFPKTQNIKVTGLPRNLDLYEDASKKNEIRQKTITKLKLDPSKKTILYAPTFRADSLNDRAQMELNFDKESLKKITSEYNFLIRPHYFIEKIVPDKGFKDVRDFRLNDLLITSDLLITDYSSIMFDYMILNKPIISYAYDLADYRNNNGTYIDPTDIGIPIIQSSKKLPGIIKEELKKNTVKSKELNKIYNVQKNISVDYVKKFIIMT